MPTYITKDNDGNITACGDWKFPGSTEVAFKVVRGYDGKFYKAGDEPVAPEPAPIEDQPPVIITSDVITVLDADMLLTAAKNGEKTAEWLIAKLEL